MTALAVTVRCGDERPPTMNVCLRGGWHDHAPLTARWREAARKAMSRKLASADIPSAPLVVTVKPWYPNRRSWPDLAAQMPAVKACIDGFVDAGLVPDDTEEYVRRLTFEPAGVDSWHGPALVFVIEGLAP